MSTCSSCGAPITWARTTTGKRIPLDPEQVIGGNILLDDNGHAHVGTPDGRPAYISHFATCPDAGGHRRSP